MKTSGLSELNIFYFRDETGLWDLSSYLIKPVQRILKYPLLLEEIYKVISFLVAFYGKFLDALGPRSCFTKDSESNDLSIHVGEF